MEHTNRNNNFFFYLKIDKNQGKPVYLQIADQLKNLIVSGQINEKDKFPPEREIAKTLDISRGTVGKAFEILKHEGYIRSIQGNGYYINPESMDLLTSKKEKAVFIIDKAIGELKSLGFSYTETQNLFHLLLSEKEKIDEELSVALADCNPEALSMFEKQIKKISGISVTKYLLPYQSEDQKKARIRSFPEPITWKHFDLVLTTVTHYKQLLNLYPELSEKLVKLSVAPSHTTMIQLGKINLGDRILVLSSSERFSQIIHFYLSQYNIGGQVTSLYSKEEDLTGLGRAIADSPFYDALDNKQVGIDELNRKISLSNFVIIPSDNESGKNRMIQALFYKNQGSVSWIVFDYKIENGSIINLEERINKLKNQKLKKLAENI